MIELQELFCYIVPYLIYPQEIEMSTVRECSRLAKVGIVMSCVIGSVNADAYPALWS